jgi:outer membrane lipoprotein-sorting protein
MDDFLIGRFRSAAEHTSGAKFLREETLEIAGKKMDSYVCHVVVVPLDSDAFPSTWWIDKKTYRVLREDDLNSDSTSTTVFTEWRLDEPQPAGLFKFTPPPGARKAPTQR